ncbi:MAG: DUF2834 domain-containing protein [Mycobacterium sp.]
MATSQKVLCGVYALVAAVALIVVWSQTLAYTHGSFIEYQRAFWTDTRATAASRTMTADILMLGSSIAILMVIEARRWGVRFVWLYILGGFFIAVSAAFPLFLIARERRIAGADAPRINTFDSVLVSLLCLGLTALSLWVTFS